MPLSAVILAAGLGTRMRSPLPKVLHPVAGRPMVEHIVRQLQALGADIVVVVHHHEQQVRDALAHLNVRFARQSAPRGTGDALDSALPDLPDGGPVIVTAGDTPLLTAASVQRLLDQHVGDATVAAFDAENPTGYGRMVRGVGIVEESACTPAQRQIRTVNSGLYVFEAAYLRRELPRLVPHAPKDELWLTDLITEYSTVVNGFSEAEFLGVNDRAALAVARDRMYDRIAREWAATGVDFASLRVAIDAEVVLQPTASIGHHVVIRGRSNIAGHVGDNCVVVDSQISEGATLMAATHAEGASVASGAKVGPMARLRPGAIIEENVHIGNFVEIKNSRIRKGVKANHLAYIGDAEVGENANVGAGTITCNYDGVRKHRTYIGNGAFIGSNTALVAPVTVGDGAIVGAGSTIAEDVPADAIAVARPPLKVIPNRAARLLAQYRLQKESAS